jgi:hypothetical protein
VEYALLTVSFPKLETANGAESNAAVLTARYVRDRSKPLSDALPITCTAPPARQSETVRLTKVRVDSELLADLEHVDSARMVPAAIEAEDELLRLEVRRDV